MLTHEEKLKQQVGALKKDNQDLLKQLREAPAETLMDSAKRSRQLGEACGQCQDLTRVNANLKDTMDVLGKQLDDLRARTDADFNASRAENQKLRAALDTALQQKCNLREAFDLLQGRYEVRHEEYLAALTRGDEALHLAQHHADARAEALKFTLHRGRIRARHDPEFALLRGMVHDHRGGLDEAFGKMVVLQARARGLNLKRLAKVAAEWELELDISTLPRGETMNFQNTGRGWAHVAPSEVEQVVKDEEDAP